MRTRGIGILSWKGYDSLRPMLQRLTQSGVTDLFHERFIFFPDIDDTARAIAEEFDFDYDGAPANLGIFGGFRALAYHMRSDTVLLLENDLLMIETPLEAARQLRSAFATVEADRAKAVFLRHTKEPGQDFIATTKYRRFFPPSDADMSSQLRGQLLQLTRPDKRQRMIGTAPYAEENPELLFEEIEQDPNTGFWLIPTNNKSWSNQSFVIDRRFYLYVLLDYVERAATKRRVNGFKNIEIELNSRWWRSKPWKIAIAPGLFTHQRTGDRGY